MYIVVGNKIVDSNTILNEIINQYPFRRVKDLTMGSKREDTLIYQIFHDVNILKEELGMEAIKQLTEEQLINELMEIADENTALIQEVMPKDMLCYSYAYRYDEGDEMVRSIFIAIHHEAGESKLKDVTERVLRSLD